MPTSKTTTKQNSSRKSSSSKAKNSQKKQPVSEPESMLSPRIRAIILGTLSVGEYVKVYDKTRKQVEMTKWRVLKKLRASEELISVLTP